MIQRHFLFLITISFLFFSSITYGFIDENNISSNPTWKYKSSENPKMRYNAFVSDIDNKAIFSLSFPERQCQSNVLNITLFYPATPNNKLFDIVKEGFHMTAFRQFYNLKTVEVSIEGNYIKATLKPIYSEMINLLDSLEKGHKMLLIWKGENHPSEPLEFNLLNSGDSIQKMYTRCMNETYEAKRQNDQ